MADGVPTYHVVAIGDVGVTTSFHLGDEAMLESAMIEVDRLGSVHWTVISANPRETTHRYGVPAIDRIGFAELSTTRERETRLSAVVNAARGATILDYGDPAQAVLDAVAGADAVLIAGGGNLSSSWPEHIYERAGLAAVAGVHKKPVIVSAQSLGPQLTGRDGELVAAILTPSQFVGVRERASARLAERLGVPADRIWCATDDATFLPDRPAPAVLAELDLDPAGFVAATFPSFAGPYPAEDLIDPLGDLLEEIVHTTGLDVVLIPHLGSTDGDRTGDTAYHDRLVEASKSDRIRSAPMLSGREGAWLTRQAALVVSSRYHPVVFGVSAAIPTVGIAVDAYTENKIRGLLELVGLQSWCVSVVGLRSGVLAAAVAEAWERRVDLTAHLSRLAPALAADKTAYWHALRRAIAGQPAPRSGLAYGEPTYREDVVAAGDWTIRNEDALGWTRLYAARSGDWQHHQARLQAELAAVAEQLAAERLARCAAADEVAALLEALAVERAAGDAARLTSAEFLDRTNEQGRQAALGQADLHEYEALQRTKLLRWSGPARALYSSWRRDHRA